MPKSSAPKSVENLSYEEAFAELEKIVAALEGEQKSLDESMSLYERGQALVKRCAELLDQAELKVRQLSGNELTGFEEAE
ncbi:MAG: exodeoxyribonuclease VII small subunit [Chloroflexi bacterium]|nr:exodeoxyribonuclease VII small subunit [Chloroflexota bacterium]MBI1855422.1 exodeoxyribonuclease VII small subunit [Chloroflexota bacterium]MBI3340467.1 exodeoxyribonuclease VII small subunit [Chloroflexota bacterium]